MYDIQDEYRMHPFISPSDLKMFLTSTRKYKRIKLDHDITTKDRADTKAMKLGNAYDAYFCAGNKTEFLKEYIIVSHKKPGEKIALIVEEAYDYCITHLWNPNSLNFSNIQPTDCDLTYKPLEDVLMNAIKTYAYNEHWGLDARLRNVIKDGNNYFETLINENGRIGISLEEFTKIESKIEELEKDSIVGPTIRMIRNLELRPAHIEVKFQVELFDENTKTKGKMDLVIINHKSKTVVIIDIKSARSPDAFKTNYFLFRYDLQGSLYHHLNVLHAPTGYKVLPTKFLVIFKESDDAPLLYAMETHDIITAEIGGVLNTWGRVEGWRQIVEEIQWLEGNSDFTHRKAYLENKSEPISSLYSNPITPNYDF